MKKLDISAIAIAMGLAFSVGAMAQGTSKEPYPSDKGSTPVGTSTPASEKGNVKEMGADVLKDAQSGKGDANYAVEKEKCDALSGDAKSNCMTKVNARFGK